MGFPHKTQGQQCYPLNRAAGFGVFERQSWVVFALKKNSCFFWKQGNSCCCFPPGCCCFPPGSSALGGWRSVLRREHLSLGFSWSSPQCWECSELLIPSVSCHQPCLQGGNIPPIGRGRDILISKLTLCVMWCC